MRKKMNKWERICLLGDWGFNIPKYHYVPQGKFRELPPDFLGLEFGERVSIRAFVSDPALSFTSLAPHYPNTTSGKAKELALDLTERYDLLLCSGIDNKNCILCGNLMLQDQGIHVEAIRGGSDITLRHLSAGKKTPEFVFSLPSPCAENEIFSKVIGLGRQFPDRGVILEWGYYSMPLGIKDECLIWWEVRWIE